jgi:hypothetical protein
MSVLPRDLGRRTRDSQSLRPPDPFGRRDAISTRFSSREAACAASVRSAYSEVAATTVARRGEEYPRQGFGRECSHILGRISASRVFHRCRLLSRSALLNIRACAHAPQCPIRAKGPVLERAGARTGRRSRERRTGGSGRPWQRLGYHWCGESSCCRSSDMPGAVSRCRCRRRM